MREAIESIDKVNQDVNKSIKNAIDIDIASQKKEYELSLMSIPSFNTLNTSELNKKPPYLINDKDGHYKIWGYKEGTWQLTEISNLKIPDGWKQEPNQRVKVSPKDAIFNTLQQGHTGMPKAYGSDEIKGEWVNRLKEAEISLDENDIYEVYNKISYLYEKILDQYTVHGETGERLTVVARINEYLDGRIIQKWFIRQFNKCSQINLV